MIQYPITFKVNSKTSPGLNTTWVASTLHHETECAVPQEFEGPGGALSPEDLFAHALTNCFIATFKVYAEHSKLSYKELTAHSVLTVDLNENKKPIMKRLDLQATITHPSSVDRSKLLAKKAFDSGFILNSVKTELHFDFHVIP